MFVNHSLHRLPAAERREYLSFTGASAHLHLQTAPPTSHRTSNLLPLSHVFSRVRYKHALASRLWRDCMLSILGRRRPRFAMVIRGGIFLKIGGLALGVLSLPQILQAEAASSAKP